jgi:hypothetical protein
METTLPDQDIMPLWNGAITIMLKLNKAAIVVIVTIRTNYGAFLTHLNKSILFGVFHIRLFQSKPTFWLREFTVIPC